MLRNHRSPWVRHRTDPFRLADQYLTRRAEFVAPTGGGALTIPFTPDDIQDEDEESLLDRLLGRAGEELGIGEPGALTRSIEERGVGGTAADVAIQTGAGLGEVIPTAVLGAGRTAEGLLGLLPGEAEIAGLDPLEALLAQRREETAPTTDIGTAARIGGRMAGEMGAFAVPGAGAARLLSPGAGLLARGAARFGAPAGLDVAYSQAGPEESVAGGIAGLTGNERLQQIAEDPFLRALFEVGTGAVGDVALEGARGLRQRGFRKRFGSDESRELVAREAAQRGQEGLQRAADEEASGFRERRAAPEEIPTDTGQRLLSPEEVEERLRAVADEAAEAAAERAPRTIEARSAELMERPEIVGRPEPDVRRPREAIPERGEPEELSTILDATGRPVSITRMVDERLRELGILRSEVEEAARRVERPALQRGPLVTPAPEPRSPEPRIVEEPAPALDLEAGAPTRTPRPEIGRQEPSEAFVGMSGVRRPDDVPAGLVAADDLLDDNLSARKADYVSRNDPALAEEVASGIDSAGLREGVTRALRDEFGDSIRVYRAGRVEPGRPQSWTTHRGTAEHFARFDDQGRMRDTPQREIAEATVRPEDVMFVGAVGDFEVVVRSPGARPAVGPPERVPETEEVARIEQERPPERNPVRARRQASETAETASRAEGEGRVVESFPVEQIQVDAERFQFKIGASEAGTTGALRDVDRFDKDLGGIVQVWRDPADGRVYVVNGHHRLALARRTGQPDVTVRFIDAATAEAARAKGALTNIAEGRGTSVDAAKFMRDTDLTPEDLADRGLSLTEAKVREATDLSKLNPTIFGAVTRGEIPAQRGAIIGGSGLSEERQLDLLKLMDKAESRGKRLTNNEVSALADEIRGTGTRTETQETLFGAEQFERSNVIERAEVRAYVKEQLAKDKRLFKAAERIGRPIEERGVGQIDVERAGALGSEAQTQEAIFDQLATGGRAGEINDILNDEAAALAAGRETPHAVKARALERIRQAVSETFGGGEGAVPGRREGAPGPRAGAEGTGGEAPDLFGPTGRPARESTEAVATETEAPPGVAASPGTTQPGAAPSPLAGALRTEVDGVKSKIEAADKTVTDELVDEFHESMHGRIERGDVDVDAGVAAMDEVLEAGKARMKSLLGDEAGSAPIVAQAARAITERFMRARRSVPRNTAETVDATVRLLGRTTDILRRSGPIGRQLARQTDTVTRLAQKWGESAKLDIEKVSKSMRPARKRGDREQVGRFLMGRIGADKLTDTQRKWAESLREIWDRDMNEFRRLGGMRQMDDGTLVPVEGSGNPMPQVLNQKGIEFLEEAAAQRGASPRVVRWAERMVKEGRAEDIEEAIAELLRFREARLRRQNPYLESTRILMDEEFVVLDPLKVARGLSERNALTIAAARVWGLDYAEGLGRHPGLDAAVGDLGREISDDAIVGRIKRFYETEVGTGQYVPKFTQQVAGAIGNYETTVRLGGSVLSALRNAGQRVANVADYPLTVQVKAFAKRPPLIHRWMKEASRIEDEILRSGAVAPRTATLDITSGPGETITNQAMRMFSLVEKGNQIHTALVAKIGLEHDINRLAKLQGADSPLGRLLRATFGGAAERRIKRALPHLTDEDLAERVMRGGLSPDEMEEAAFRLVNNTQFAINMATKQTWWDTNPALRLAFKFKTFGLRQLEVIWNQVIKEAAHGNPAPIARFTLSTMVLGELYNIARDNVVGDEQALTSRLLGKSKEGVSGSEVAWTLAKNLADGGGIGMLADMTFGIGSYLYGPVGSTIGNAAKFGEAVLNRPSDVKDAAKILAGKEVSVLRQAKGLKEKHVDDNQRFFDYRTWRQRAFEHRTAKEQDTVGRKVAGFGTEAISGKPSFDMTDRTLRYKAAADYITANDLEAATEYLTSILKDAKDGRERRDLITGIRNSAAAKSPLGPVSEADRRAFLSKFPRAQQEEARRVQREWERDYERALRAAIRAAR